MFVWKTVSTSKEQEQNGKMASWVQMNVSFP